MKKHKGGDPCALRSPFCFGPLFHRPADDPTTPMKLRSSLSMVWLVLLAGAPVSLAHNTAFSYQGRLNRGTGAATGLYDFQFGLFTADSGGTQQGVTVAADAVPVTAVEVITSLLMAPGTWTVVAIEVVFPTLSVPVSVYR